MTQPEPTAAILAVVETALNDQLTDSARAEALDGIQRILGEIAATPAELERRQRYAWNAAGLCPMCSHEDGKGWLCDVCTTTVRRMKPRDRKPWRRFEQPSTSTPIQGSGYTPAELLGIDTTEEPTP